MNALLFPTTRITPTDAVNKAIRAERDFFAACEDLTLAAKGLQTFDQCMAFAKRFQAMRIAFDDAMTELWARTDHLIETH
jgi:hypothetical protein